MATTSGTAPPIDHSPAVAPLPLLAEPGDVADLLGSGVRLIDIGDDEHYRAGHLPGAVPVSYAQLIAGGSPAPGLLPDSERLSQLMQDLGISPQSGVVAYDHSHGGPAARFLWTLHAVGHTRASVLNGGIAAWVADGYSLTGEPCPPPADMTVPQRALVDGVLADIDYVRSRIGDRDVVLVDVRSPAEFQGRDRRADRAGHIPGAVNFEWTQTMNPARQQRLLEDGALRELLAARGISPEKEIIVYCQTHHRSAHTYLVLKHLGYPRVRGYAGSWAEWGNRHDTPVA